MWLSADARLVVYGGHLWERSGAEITSPVHAQVYHGVETAGRR